MFEYILYLIYFLLPSSFIYINIISSLLSLLNAISVDIVDDEGSFQFSPEAEFTSPLCVHITRATDTEAEITVLCTTATMLKTY